MQKPLQQTRHEEHSQAMSGREGEQSILSRAVNSQTTESSRELHAGKPVCRKRHPHRLRSTYIMYVTSTELSLRGYHRLLSSGFRTVRGWCSMYVLVCATRTCREKKKKKKRFAYDAFSAEKKIIHPRRQKHIGKRRRLLKIESVRRSRKTKNSKNQNVDRHPWGGSPA